MAFKLIPKEQNIKWPVTVLDQDESGNIAEFPVTLHFRFAQDFRKTTQAEALVDWEGVLDGDGSPLPCTPENKQLAFGHIGLAKAINDSFFAVARGEHLRKN